MTAKRYYFPRISDSVSMDLLSFGRKESKRANKSYSTPTSNSNHFPKHFIILRKTLLCISPKNIHIAL